MRSNHKKMDDDEISVWEILNQLKSGKYWLIGGGLLGVISAIGYLVITPERYEVTAILQPATVGMVIESSIEPKDIEPIAQTYERLKLITFYDDSIVDTCQSNSSKELVAKVKVGIVKGNNLISISYQASSPVLAKNCMNKIVGKLIKSQETIAAPLLTELKSQMASTKQQLDNTEQFLMQSEKRVTSNSSSQIESVMIMLKRDYLMKLQKVYQEQRVQLTEPITQSMKLLEPVYTSEKPVYPNKILTISTALIGGLLLGTLALIYQLGWRRYKAAVTKYTS